MVGTIFISHSHQDAAVARDIAEALEHAGLKPWIDQCEIKPGDSLIGKMDQGLSEASYVLLLLSREANASHWVRREWMSGLANRQIVLVPLLLDNSSVPAILRDIVYIDLRQDRQAGIERIVEFFQLEQRRISPLTTRRADFSLMNASRRQLRLLAMRCLDQLGLQSFCFDADLDWGSLGGASVHEKLVSLLHAAALEGLLPRFAQWLETERERCVKHQLRELEDQPAWKWPADAEA